MAGSGNKLDKDNLPKKTVRSDQVELGDTVYTIDQLNGQDIDQRRQIADLFNLQVGMIFLQTLEETIKNDNGAMADKKTVAHLQSIYDLHKKLSTTDKLTNREIQQINNLLQNKTLLKTLGESVRQLNTEMTQLMQQSNLNADLLKAAAKVAGSIDKMEANLGDKHEEKDNPLADEPEQPKFSDKELDEWVNADFAELSAANLSKDEIKQIYDGKRAKAYDANQFVMLPGMSITMTVEVVTVSVKKDKPADPKKTTNSTLSADTGGLSALEAAGKPIDYARWEWCKQQAQKLIKFAKSQGKSSKDLALIMDSVENLQDHKIANALYYNDTLETGDNEKVMKMMEVLQYATNRHTLVPAMLDLGMGHLLNSKDPLDLQEQSSHYKAIRGENRDRSAVEHASESTVKDPEGEMVPRVKDAKTKKEANEIYKSKEFTRLRQNWSGYLELSHHTIDRAAKLLTQKRHPKQLRKMGDSIAKLKAQLEDYLKLMTDLGTPEGRARATGHEKKGARWIPGEPKDKEKAKEYFKERVAEIRSCLDRIYEVEDHLYAVSEQEPALRAYYNLSAAGEARNIPEGATPEQIQAVVNEFIDPKGELPGPVTLLTGDAAAQTTDANFQQRFIPHYVRPSSNFKFARYKGQKIAAVESVNEDHTFSETKLYAEDLDKISKSPQSHINEFAAQLVETALASVPQGPINLNDDRLPEKLGQAMFMYCKMMGYGVETEYKDKYFMPLKKTEKFAKAWHKAHPDQDVDNRQLRQIAKATDTPKMDRDFDRDNPTSGRKPM